MAVAPELGGWDLGSQVPAASGRMWPMPFRPVWRCGRK